MGFIGLQELFARRHKGYLADRWDRRREHLSLNKQVSSNLDVLTRRLGVVQ